MSTHKLQHHRSLRCTAGRWGLILQVQTTSFICRGRSEHSRHHWQLCGALILLFCPFFHPNSSSAQSCSGEVRLKAQKQALPRGAQLWQMAPAETAWRKRKNCSAPSSWVGASWVMVCSGQRAARTTVTPSWYLWMFNALLFRTDYFRSGN